MYRGMQNVGAVRCPDALSMLSSGRDARVEEAWYRLLGQTLALWLRLPYGMDRCICTTDNVGFDVAI